MTSLEDRFWARVEKTPTCWLWKGGKSDKGYGGFHVGNRKYVKAHKFSYELAHGPVPDGMEIDHKCRVKLCVRPKHLEAVTHAENMKRVVWSPEALARQREVMTGRRHTEAAKAHMSKAKKGKPNPAHAERMKQMWADGKFKDRGKTTG